jgi:hypothetical protein
MNYLVVGRRWPKSCCYTETDMYSSTSAASNTGNNRKRGLEHDLIHKNRSLAHKTWTSEIMITNSCFCAGKCFGFGGLGRYGEGSTEILHGTSSSPSCK